MNNRNKYSLPSESRRSTFSNVVSVWRLVYSQVNKKGQCCSGLQTGYKKSPKVVLISPYFLAIEDFFEFFDFKFLIDNDGILCNQFGFKLSDSCINNFLSSAHEIYESFDCGYVRGILLNLFKALDKFWQNYIMLKLLHHVESGTKWRISQFT